MYCEAAGCETYFNKKDHLWTLYEYENGAFKIPKMVENGMIYGGCNCHLTILPTGDIFACRRVQNSKVGNVFEDRIADVWICQMELLDLMKKRRSIRKYQHLQIEGADLQKIIRRISLQIGVSMPGMRCTYVHEPAGG